jgi:FkbM family methyltransferase
MFDFLMSLAQRIPARPRHKMWLRTGQFLDIFPRADMNMLQQALMLYVGLKEGVEFKSQYCQDLVAYAYFNGKRDGFFVDICAHDGVLGSNTFVFEKLGWKGFCVEPNPEIFVLLQKNRICDIYECAVTATAGETVDFMRFKGTDINSQLSVIVNPTLRSQTRAGDKEIIKVKTTTFSNLMDRYPEVTNIDFLSLDTEGCELAILKTIDFNRYQFGLLAVEANSPEIPALLASKGYRLLANLWGDGLFVRQG